MTVHLCVFSDESMSRSKELCIESGLTNGMDAQWSFSPINMRKIRAVQENPCIFRQPDDMRRAWAWWAWKPLIIEQSMILRNKGDILVYADAGIEFINNVNYIIDRMGHDKPQDDVWLFGNNWDHAHWCKRDVLDALMPQSAQCPACHKWCGGAAKRMPCEAGYYYHPTIGKQVQASVIFFRVSDYTRAFVAEWLKWCLFENGRLIDDSPSRLQNHPEFREHRHDQAILTTLAYREGIKLHYWPAVYNKGGSPEFVYEKLLEYAGDDYPVLFSHHRRRNHEWETRI